jgi:hypothetical protein
MINNKISSYPPVKNNTVDEFILAAEQKKRDSNIEKSQNTQYPWEDNNIRQDVQKVFTAKLPEAYLLKIKFISDSTNKSQQRIIREIICKEVDRLIADLAK